MYMYTTLVAELLMSSIDLIHSVDTPDINCRTKLFNNCDAQTLCVVANRNNMMDSKEAPCLKSMYQIIGKHTFSFNSSVSSLDNGSMTA